MGNEHIWDLIAKKLSKEATEEELTELESLLRHNPELHYPIQTIADLWHSNHYYSKSEALDAFNRHLERMQLQNVEFNVSQEPISENKKSFFRRKFFVFGVTGILVVISVFMAVRLTTNTVQSSSSTKDNSVVFTKNGSKTNLVLPDGTHVWLNAGSRITYDKNYGNNLREVVLSGEAFFDVVKNAEKPFIIHTGKIDIKVLGTEFNVKSYPGEKTIETSLIRGSIEVTFKDRPSEKVILKPNEKLVVVNEDVPALMPKKQVTRHVNDPIVAISHLNFVKSDTVETAWMQNKLIFQDKSFLELADEMQRWYGINIHFDNSQVDTLHFTGIFKNETIQQALEALQLTSKFNFSVRENQVRIYK
ncbi:MAG TPA: FecR family protein [Puia sp.]|nr:FecR family protein [Puia sp.]